MEIKTVFLGILMMIPYLILGFVAIYVVYLLQSFKDRFVQDDEDAFELVEPDPSNTASGIRMAGLFFAIGIGLSGVFAGGSHGFLEDLKLSVIYGILLVIATQVALWVNDAAILPSVDNSDEVGKGNVAVALVEFGGMMATGLIGRGAVMGEHGGWTTFVVFFVLGQAALVALVFAYEKLKLKRFSLVREVDRGNVAAGILLGGKLWAYGLILAAAVAGNFTGWGHDLVAFATTALAGFVFLYVADWAVDRYIVTDFTAQEIVEGRHIRPALVLSGGKIAMAFVISTIAI